MVSDIEPQGIVAYDLVAPGTSCDSCGRNPMSLAMALGPVGCPACDEVLRKWHTCPVCGKLDNWPAYPLRNALLRPSEAAARNGEHLACQEKLAHQQKEATEACYQEAHADWDVTVRRNGLNKVGAAALALHAPVVFGSRIACMTCKESDGCDGVQGVSWSCETYTAVRMAVRRS